MPLMESDLAEIHPGVEVRVLANAYPGKTLRSSVLSIAPIAEPPDAAVAQAPDLIRHVNLVRSEVRVDNAEGELRPGMTGRVQFKTQPRTLAAKVWRTFSLWAASLFW